MTPPAYQLKRKCSKRWEIFHISVHLTDTNSCKISKGCTLRYHKFAFFANKQIYGIISRGFKFFLKILLFRIFYAPLRLVTARLRVIQSNRIFENSSTVLLFFQTPLCPCTIISLVYYYCFNQSKNKF